MIGRLMNRMHTETVSKLGWLWLLTTAAVSPMSGQDSPIRND